MYSIYNKIKEQLSGLAKKGGLHIFLGNTFTKFVAFFGSIFIINLLTKSEYGTLGYVENLYHYAYLLAGLGMTNALLRYVVLAPTPEEKKSYYSYIIRRSIQVNIVLVVIMVAIMVLYPHPNEFAQARWLLPILLLALPVQSLNDSQITIYRAMFDNRRYALTAFATVTLVIAGKYILSLVLRLPGAVIATPIVYGLLALVVGFLVYRRYFRGKSKVQALNSEQKKEVLTYSLQYMVTNGIWALFMLNDIFLLGRLTGDSQMVADYKVAYVLPGNLSLISASIGVLVAPYFMRNENNIPWVRRAYKKTYLATAGLMALAVGFLYVFAHPVISLLYPKYIDVVPVMRVLLIASFINNGIRYTNAHLLSSMGQIKYNMYVSLGGVLLQIGINLWSIPRYGAMGLAYTSITVYSLMALALIVVFYRRYFYDKAS
jgi:O-antigen/teichoic acid export membrane protein